MLMCVYDRTGIGDPPSIFSAVHVRALASYTAASSATPTTSSAIPASAMSAALSSAMLVSVARHHSAVSYDSLTWAKRHQSGFSPSTTCSCPLERKKLQMWIRRLWRSVAWNAGACGQRSLPTLSKRQPSSTDGTPPSRYLCASPGVRFEHLDGGLDELHARCYKTSQQTTRDIPVSK